jgi:hypothetical protein
MSGLIGFAEVKARCSIEQAAKLLHLKCTEQRNQLRGAPPGLRRRPALSQETGELTATLGSLRRSSRRSFTFPMWSHFQTALQRKCWGFLYPNRRCGSQLTQLVLIRLDHARWEQTCSP